MADNQQGKVARAKDRLDRAGQRFPWLGHVIAMVKHYGDVKGNVLAGAVTYFGFLSFFPILAISFAVVGYISVAYPDARDSLVTAIEQLFPGIVTVDGADGTLSIRQIESAKAAAGLIGFALLLYSGLGWLSGLRSALAESFELPHEREASFVVGKLVDLFFLALLGTILIVSVGLTGTAGGLTGRILDWIGLDETVVGPVLVWSVTTALGLAASTLLFFVMYRLLGRPDLPTRPLVQGAFLGAVGFELLKFLAVTVLDGVGGSAFAPLAVAVTLMVWINYFSRLVFYGASWAMTSPLSQEALASRRVVAAQGVLDEVEGTPDERQPAAAGRSTATDRRAAAEPAGRFDLGSALVGGAAGLLAAFVFWRRD